MGLYSKGVIEQHIYYVNFDPVEKNEFDGKHMAIVLQKNKDNQTAIVMPLTSSSKGDNKLNLGKIHNLPGDLNKRNSYLVLDQMRTVNYNRFSQFIDKGNYIQVKIDDAFFYKAIESVLLNSIRSMELDNKIDFFIKILNKLKLEKLVNLCYSWKKLEEKQKIYEKEIKELIDLSVNYEEELNQKDIDNGIFDLINNLKK